MSTNVYCCLTVIGTSEEVKEAIQFIINVNNKKPESTRMATDLRLDEKDSRKVHFCAKCDTPHKDLKEFSIQFPNVKFSNESWFTSREDSVSINVWQCGELIESYGFNYRLRLP